MKQILLFLLLLSVACGSDDPKDTDPVLAADEIAHAGSTWKLFNSDFYSVVTNNATTLHLDLAQNAIWFNASTGGMIYRLVDGDFTLSAHVNAVKRTDHSQSVSCSACFGGLVARNPAGANQNYVHVVTGGTPNGIGAETKTTRNSDSGNQVANTSDPGWFTYVDAYTSHDLRLTRVGNVFSMYKKSPVDVNWVLLTSYTREDLPSELQVGMNIYTSVSGPLADLSVIFENITLQQ